MKLRLLLLASLLGFVAGCAAPASPSIPTPIPPEFLPTVIAQTAESANLAATETAFALIPPTLLVSASKPTSTLAPVATVTQTSIPGHNLAAISIGAPGPASKVVSPITLKLNIVTGKSKLIQIDLYGEDGRLLTRLLKKNVPTSSDGVDQTIKIAFEISAAAELGRISVSTQDEFGRVQSLNSVRVLLLSSGENEITTQGNPYEPIQIFNPRKKDAGTEGVLNVRGDLWPFSLEPIFVELIAPDGKVLSVRLLNPVHINPQTFTTTLPYKITEPVIARLTIRQNDDRIEGMFYLYSQEVLLNP